MNIKEFELDGLEDKFNDGVDVFVAYDIYEGDPEILHVVSRSALCALRDYEHDVVMKAVYCDMKKNKLECEDISLESRINLARMT